MEEVNRSKIVMPIHKVLNNKKGVEKTPWLLFMIINNIFI